MTDYANVPIADILRVAALNADLTSDASHPQNAIYRVPLSSADDESLARGMADIVFGAVTEKYADEPGFDSEKAFHQCLVDARRMVCEPDYERLFDGQGVDSLDEIVRQRARHAWRRVSNA